MSLFLKYNVAVSNRKESEIMECPLKLPTNYSSISEEEMMYLEAGDAKNFAKNLYGLVKNAAMRKAAGIPSWAAIAKMSYWTAVATFPTAMAKIASLTGNPIVIGLVAAGGVAAVTYLWNVRVFY